MIAERILVALSRPVDQGDYPGKAEAVETAIEPLVAVFPGFEERIRGKRVLDFGCGHGFQALAMLRAGAGHVVGVDSNLRALNVAREAATRYGVTAGLTLVDHLDSDHAGSFDVILSKDSMEHFAEPAAVLALMKALLHPEGEILITFGPPWYAPYGSHAQYFTRFPWVNILFPEKAVMKVRSRYRSDGAMRYEDIEGGLNRMTTAKFEKLVAGSGLKMHERRYDCVKGLTFLNHVPVARELFINNISCSLKHAISEAGN